jgi:Na+/glutamate symporter
MIGAVRQAMPIAGQKLAQFFANPGTQSALKDIGKSTALLTGLEQGIPLIMGTAPQVGLGESLARNALTSGLGYPVTAGLSALGVNPTLGHIAGSIAGSMGTEALIGRPRQAAQQQPPQLSPEVAQSLYMQQMQQQVEQQRIQNEIALAQARNTKPPSFMYHQSHGDPAAIAHDLLRQGMNVSY